MAGATTQTFATGGKQRRAATATSEDGDGRAGQRHEPADSDIVERGHAFSAFRV